MYQSASRWEAGWSSSNRKPEMRQSVTHRMDDDQVLAMGVLEPILVLLLIAVIATLLELLA